MAAIRIRTIEVFVPLPPALHRLLAGGLAVVLLAGCGVLELGGSAHEAVTLEQASMEDGQWAVTVELLATDIAGDSVIELRASLDEVSCEDGSDLPEDGIPLGSLLRFVQVGDVLQSDPPQVSGEDVEVECA